MTIVYSQFEFDASTKLEGRNDAMKQITKLIDVHLSEPYSIYVYRFFLNSWPQLCYTAVDSEDPDTIIACIISKVEPHRNVRMRGYIGMLAVEPKFRGLGIAKTLIDKSLTTMIDQYNTDEIILETEVDNKKALQLYENFGFIRTKRLFRYYLNKHDAYRLVLPVTHKACIRTPFLEQII
ncbi:unnamed protein product [Kuraishia capsulata CBS 1993]|uniref:N-acetyltransferase domain-containing protein n=1 Tax=Kuraishia capsulata CBS 1993 TaxID=1382522 RepID=W6MGU8_9ASCO|nr:uncharacterized protein KUCA_T00000800001 [Kuraishia capsulata CBS 1993]CDK24833.1 unnamed protein product [Kuraishia capsulata CBS 1993]